MFCRFDLRRVRSGLRGLSACVATALLAFSAEGSSHMDAPLITLDDAANTTDVYAFVSEAEGTKFLTTALAVYPFEEPGIGPNIYRFDDQVRYEIHVARGEDLTAGRPTVTYRFEFGTRFQDTKTFRSYLGVINEVNDPNQNLRQDYTVTKIVRDALGAESSTALGRGVVPPNNQGIVTPFYNRENDGDRPVRDGVASPGDLDRYTNASIARFEPGYMVFAGQREDGFFADINAIFDNLNLKSGDDRFDSQGGFNVHTIVLNIPVSELGGDLQIVGVYATTSRPRIRVLRSDGEPRNLGDFVQVGRQGNPLFCEALVANEDKDLYNRTSPTRDRELFRKYAASPELARLLNSLGVDPPAVAEDRTDLVRLFIPDLIKVDLSTDRARLAGGSRPDSTTPNEPGFSRLGIFGEDTLISRVQPGFGDGVIPGGWPNGRRFGDDVVDIAVSAIRSDLRQPRNPETLFLFVADGIDNVSTNDVDYNQVFPYAAPPINGRRHTHD